MIAHRLWEGQNTGSRDSKNQKLPIFLEFIPLEAGRIQAKINIEKRPRKNLQSKFNGVNNRYRADESAPAFAKASAGKRRNRIGATV